MLTIDDVTFEWAWEHRLGAERAASAGKPVARRLNLKLSYENGFYTLASENVGLSVRVTSNAANPERYRVGFSQTIYRSFREYYYFSSKRTKNAEVLNKVPVWDGDTDDSPPWFGVEPDEYDKDEGGWEAYFTDSPMCMALSESPKGLIRTAQFGWEKDPRAQDEGATLFYISGYDTFAAFICVHDTERDTIHPLDHVPWYVRFGARIDAVRKTGLTDPDSGTYVGVVGTGYTGTPTLDGESAEFHDTAVVSEWSPGTLPPAALEWLKYKKA